MHSSLSHHSQARLSQVLRKMSSENAHGCTQKEDKSLGFDFFRVIPQKLQDFLDHIIRVTRDET
jgi:hypothetical protein